MKTTQKNPKVSVLVPIYNVEKYLPECLDSLVNQTLAEIEIICINDGSTDDSLKIIKRYAKQDKRIRIIDKPNSGYGDSMNQGLEMATGEYIGIVESDDFIECNAFEQLYALAKNFDADVVRSNYFHYKGGKNKLYDYVELSDTYKVVNPALSKWIFYQAPAIWSAIYRREFLKEKQIRFLPTPGASYQDTGFNFKVWVSTTRAVFTSEAYLHYRLDNESSSVNNPGKIFSVCDEYAEIERYLRENGLYSQFGEIMQTAKFAAYYWNIHRLSPDLRGDFVQRTKMEFAKAKEEGSINNSLFVDRKQIKLLNYILNHDTKRSLRYIKQNSTQQKFEQKLKKNVKRVLKISPRYKNQKTISKLINDLTLEVNILRQQVKQLKDEQNGKK